MLLSEKKVAVSKKEKMNTVEIGTFLEIYLHYYIIYLTGADFVSHDKTESGKKPTNRRMLLIPPGDGTQQ